MKKMFYLLPVVGLMASCSPQTYVKKDPVVIGFPKTTDGVANRNASQEAPQKVITVSQPMVGMMPKATAFKMNGDYADKVAISLGSDGQLTYFPAPSDISPASAPTSLGNGWYLNNQGLGENSVFTKYTFEEYSKLPSVPTPQQLKDAIIPGSKVVRMVELPYSIGDAKSNIQGIKDYVKSL